MSTISGITSSNSNLSILLQQAARSQSGSAVDGTHAAGSVLDPSITDADGDGDNSSASSSGLKDKVQDAVKEAVKNFNPSGSLSDLLKTIRSTVSDTLKANGVDPSQGQGAGRAHGHHHHHHAAQDSGDASQPTDGSSPESIDQRLSDNGVDPSQLKQELIDAIENPGSSSTSAKDVMSEIFKDLPKGSAVDVNA